MRKPNWTSREDNVAAAMHTQGISDTDIGSRLGRSADAVRRRRWQLMSPEDRAKIGRVELNSEIYSLVQKYAEREGIKTSTAANELLRGALGAA